jgi:hypothetical protein
MFDMRTKDGKPWIGKGRNAKRKTWQDVVAELVAVHGNTYSYPDQPLMNKCSDKIRIVCKVHGEFLQNFSSHLKGIGCKACGIEKSIATRATSTDKFIKKAKAVHGDRYDYSKTKYTGVKDLITITCLIHGDFHQTPNTHLNGSGCNKCALEKSGEEKRLSLEDVIDEFRKIHGDKYDYSKITYKNTKIKLTIVCPEHGEFRQTRYTHKRAGCPECGKKTAGEKLSKFLRDKSPIPWEFKEFKEKAEEIHNFRYEYPEQTFSPRQKYVTVICKKHGEFKQPIVGHINGNGCSRCKGEEFAARVSYSKEQFIERAIEVHGNFYDYSEVVYKPNSREKIKIICPIHGEFFQLSSYHLNGFGCKKCGLDTVYLKLAKTDRQFIEDANEVHKYKYDYCKVDYVSSKNKVTIICKKHGEFQQKPNGHLGGQGCPVCGGLESKRERDINEFLSNYFETENRKRGILNNKRQELDIYIPEKNFAIEYNGSIWHSEKYNKDPIWHMRKKQLECEEKGIRLIHASEYQDQTVIKKTLAMILGINDESYYARKCKVELGRSSDLAIKKFLNENHLQGEVSGCEADYLTLNGQMVAVMAFSKASSERGNRDATRWELRRYSSVCRIVGGASRLLKQFIRRHPECTCIISYSDNAWFTGNMYEKLGFKFVKDVAPDYKRVQRQGIVKTKANFQRRYLAKMEGFDFRPEETEQENCFRNGWYRLYDCGKKKWELDLAG